MMGLTKDMFTNKNNNFKTVTFNVTDGYQEITPVDEVVVTIVGHFNTTDYDGAEHEVTGYDVTISNPLYKESDFTFSDTAAAARTDAGKTMMGLTKDMFANTNTNFKTVTFNVTDGYQEITPINATVTITGHFNTTDYDGTEHEVSGYDVDISTPLYKESDFTFSGSDTAARTDAGKTMMGLKADQFANTNTNFKTVTFLVTDGYQEITPIDTTVTITGHFSSVDYDATEHAVTGYDVDIENPLYKETDFTFTGSAEAKRTDAGKTMMGLTKDMFANTNPNFRTVTFIVTDGYQEIVPINTSVTITGHNNTSDYDGTEHIVTGYDVDIESPLYKESDFTFSGNAEAKRTDAGTTNMNLAADQFANTNPNFATVTFTVIDGYQTIDPIDTTVTVTGHKATYMFDGRTHAAEGYDVEIESPLYKESDFTFSGEAKVEAINAGVYAMGLDAGQFENTNPNFRTVTFNVTDGELEITKRPVTLKSESATKIYDGKPLVRPVVQILGEGFAETDNIVVYATGSVTDVGTAVNAIEIVYPTALATASADNYDITLDEGTLEVTPRIVTVRADSKVKKFGSKDPELTATVSGLLNGDTVDYTLEREPGEKIGEYPITPSGEETQGNYIVVYVPGTLRITKPGEFEIVWFSDAKIAKEGARTDALAAMVDWILGCASDANVIAAFTTGSTAGTFNDADIEAKAVELLGKLRSKYFGIAGTIDVDGDAMDYGPFAARGLLHPQAVFGDGEIWVRRFAEHEILTIGIGFHKLAETDEEREEQQKRIDFVNAQIAAVDPAKCSTILFVNDYVDEAGSLTEFGKLIEEEIVKKNAGVRLILSSCTSGTVRTEMQYDGRTVNVLAFNYAADEENGLGFMRILRFDPDTRDIAVTTYSPVYDREFYDEAKKDNDMFTLTNAY